MAKKSEEAAAPAAAAAVPAGPTPGESETCTTLEAAIRACDELGYPVMVDGVVHEKKVWAIGACEKVLGGPGKAVSGASVVVARPNWKK